MIVTILVEAFKGAAVGGVIGYLTNWLAVWMLFHPRRPTRLLGWTLPLTPGLVVKNQDRLADAIGRAVARDLLDSRTLIAHLQEIDLAQPIAAVLREDRAKLAATRGSLAGVIGPDHRDALLRLHQSLCDDLSGRVAGGLGRLAQKDDLLNDLLQPLLGDALDAPLGRLLTPERRHALRAWIQDRLADATTSGQTHRLLFDALRRLLDALPGSPAARDLASALQDSLRPQYPRFCAALQQSLADYIASESFAETARPRLSARLYTLIIERFSMAAMLLNQKTIDDLLATRWDVIAGELQQLVLADGLRDVLAEKIDVHAGRALDDIAGGSLASDQRDRLAGIAEGHLGGVLGDIARSDAVADTLDRLLEHLADRPVRALLANDAALAGDLVRQALDHLTAWASSDTGRARIRERISGFLDHLLFEMPVGDMLTLIPEAEWNAFAEALGRLFEERTRRLLPRLLEDRIDLASVVSDRIRAFDVEKLEQTIIRVSDRELKGIVRLGGVIGVVVGAAMQIVYWAME